LDILHFHYFNKMWNSQFSLNTLPNKKIMHCCLTGIKMIHSSIGWSCTYELSVNEQFCCIYLNYLTLRSKVKVPRKSLWYATYRLMIMHPHTNYHWSTSKDKNAMAWTRKYCENQQGGRHNDFRGTLTFDLKVK
jgi:hypothetical protein